MSHLTIRLLMTSCIPTEIQHILIETVEYLRNITHNVMRIASYIIANELL